MATQGSLSCSVCAEEFVILRGLRLQTRDDSAPFQETTESLSVPNVMCWQTVGTFTTARGCCDVFMILAPVIKLQTYLSLKEIDAATGKDVLYDSLRTVLQTQLQKHCSNNNPVILTLSTMSVEPLPDLLCDQTSVIIVRKFLLQKCSTEILVFSIMSRTSLYSVSEHCRHNYDQWYYYSHFVVVCYVIQLK